MDTPLNKTTRNLPHWHREGSTAIYWITFRLADSLPKPEIDALKNENFNFPRFPPATA
jgi:hypothetical protein